jgi:hypothetical protein
MNQDAAIAKIARILRIDKNFLTRIAQQLERASGRSDLLQILAEENDAEILEALDALNLHPKANAAEVYDALLSKLEADDLAIFELFRKPDYTKPEAYKTVLGFAREFSGVTTGFFMKHEKAREFLINQPPPKILQALGYKNINELLEKEDLIEIFAALRFIEGSDWLNKVFFKQYSTLQIEDFEERPIEVRVISPRWVEAAKTFMEKKYHNLSHLKELGAVFVIPWSLGLSGETMRMFSLLLHYMHEVDFYSRLFRRYSDDPATFSLRVISALRGDILESRPTDETTWLIVQRYLAKDDENDWRLFWPHVNPEAIHWQKAERDLTKIGVRFGLTGLGFWHNLGWVGDYFKTEAGIDVLVSFNLIDTAMSVVKEKEFIKYLYHHQEALWNKIFSMAFGEEAMERMVEDNFIEGAIRLQKSS